MVFKKIADCETCGEALYGGSHYHCGRCHDKRPTSMLGHYVTFKDKTSGMYCDPANLGKEFISGGRKVTEDMIRDEKKLL